MISRRQTREIAIGAVGIGNGHPVSVQSMTNTFTTDVEATVAQIHRLEAAGCDLIRVAVPDMEAAAALQSIRDAIAIPLIADIHFDSRLAVAAMEHGAQGIRINPGNLGGKDKIARVVAAANSIMCRSGSGSTAGRSKRICSRPTAIRRRTTRRP